MMEPLSVAVHSVSSLGKLKSGQNVIVFGAGPVGLLIMAVAKALGAKKVVAVDINEERLKFAKGYAATHTFVPVSIFPHRPCIASDNLSHFSLPPRRMSLVQTTLSELLAWSGNLLGFPSVAKTQSISSWKPPVQKSAVRSACTSSSRGRSTDVF